MDVDHGLGGRVKYDHDHTAAAIAHPWESHVLVPLTRSKMQ